MGRDSAIEWTHHTFNPWMGCTKVSAGCANCYAERDMDHRFGKVQWGPGRERKLTSLANWRKPLAWDAAGKAAGVRQRVFCASLADVFDAEADDIPGHRGDNAREEQWALMVATPNIDWLVLTKRPERILEHVPFDWLRDGWPGNVWIGTSVEDQPAADERINQLARVPARVRFLSMEPLIARTGLDRWFGGRRGWRAPGERLAFDWVIAGGESGPRARPMHTQWARDIRDQCAEAGVPFFFKQWGEWRTFSAADFGGDRAAWLAHEAELQRAGVERFVEADGSCRYRVGKHAAGRLLDGRTHDAFPGARP